MVLSIQKVNIKNQKYRLKTLR